MHVIDILPGDSVNLVSAEFGPKVALDDALELPAGGRAIFPLDVLGNVAIKQVIDGRRRAERFPFTGGIALVNNHRLQNPLRRRARGVSGDLAMLADAEPP
jgi:2-keto-3-deoxy-6-phosphogluconate aldolase